MQILERRIEAPGIRGFALDGGLDHTTTKEFVARIDALLVEGVRFVVLDLSKLAYASSLGLAALVRVHRHFTVAGGRIVFANLHTSVARVLAVAQLDRLFDLYPTVDEAVRSLAPNTGAADRK